MYLLRQEAQLSLEKADCTTYIQSPASDFQSRRKSDFSEMTQFHACYVNKMWLSKSTINASITHIAHSDMQSSHQATSTASRCVNNQWKYQTQVLQIFLTIKNSLLWKMSSYSVPFAVLTFKVIHGQ